VNYGRKKLYNIDTWSVNRPDLNVDNSVPSICNDILESVPLNEGSFHETALVTVCLKTFCFVIEEEIE
jgi:hypothetical protein